MNCRNLAQNPVDCRRGPQRLSRRLGHITVLLPGNFAAANGQPVGAGTTIGKIHKGKRMSTRPFNVLFLCTGNSARSIMAEVLLNSVGGGKFRAYSAGSHPKGEVHHLALELIERNHLPAAGLRSKSLSEVAQPDAPEMDFVFTICDQAAGETCPVWPGQPMTAHWGIDDPAAGEGAEAERRRGFCEGVNA